MSQTIDEYVDQKINESVADQVAVMRQQVESLRPWIYTAEVHKQTGKSPKWIREHWAKFQGKESEPFKLGLVVKPEGENEWRFANPEFLYWVHNQTFPKLKERTL